MGGRYPRFGHSRSFVTAGTVGNGALLIGARFNPFRRLNLRSNSVFAPFNRAALAAFMFVLLCQQAVAGWYEVENYEGEIAGSPISLSLQYYSFGSGITVEGSYYFLDERRPVAIYGGLQHHGVRLCEISSEAELQRIIVTGSKTPFDFAKCPLVLSLKGNRAVGRWKRGGVDHAVDLKKIASLDDSDEPSVKGPLVIPFWAQTPTYMFAGTYENTSSGICMTKVAFINKLSGKTDHELRYGGDPCDAGMVMTPIYLNVQTWIEAGAEIISINFGDGAAGSSEDYVYDDKAKRFVSRQ